MNQLPISVFRPLAKVETTEEDEVSKESVRKPSITLEHKLFRPQSQDEDANS